MSGRGVNAGSAADAFLDARLYTVNLQYPGLNNDFKIAALLAKLDFDGIGAAMSCFLMRLSPYGKCASQSHWGE